MEINKEYLRYIPARNFNIVASSNCNVVFVLNEQGGRYVAVGACEHVCIHDLGLDEKAQVLLGEKSPATFLCASPNESNLAVGYADRNIQTFNLKTAEIVCKFSGHKSEITALAYDSFGHKLGSGSKDTDIILWDTVAGSGLYGLSGHKEPITQITLMSNRPVLISVATDTLVKFKFWDLDNHHCFRTLMGHLSDVWSLTLAKYDKFLDVLNVRTLSDKSADGYTKHRVEEVTTIVENVYLEDFNDSAYTLQCHKPCSLLRNGKGCLATLVSDLSGQIVACHGKDSKLEFFNFFSDDEAQARFKKRLKRQTGYVLTAIFAPDNRHVLAGLKDGKLVIIDIAAGDVVEGIPTHEGELRSICLEPNLRSCVTGGEDATVIFWRFKLIVTEENGSKAKILSLLHKRTLMLEQPVLCVKISPNSKFIAVSLLYSTVKLFFLDTFKFCRSLFT